MQVPHKAWVLVADGERFVVFENHGDSDLIDLRVVDSDYTDNPADHLQGSDRPGRMNDPSAGHKSAVDATNWHVLEKQYFAEETAAKLNDWALGKKFSDLVVVADPRTLGSLRTHYSQPVKAKLRRELDKDLTHLPVNEVEQALVRL
ncbi:host attachment family protein [Nisaea sp.]|uniref:host attachment family protein n=1 Tax=Nisaea sp. TaxID=2024842 RepID=UPI003B528A05